MTVVFGIVWMLHPIGNSMVRHCHPCATAHASFTALEVWTADTQVSGPRCYHPILLRLNRSNFFPNPSSSASKCTAGKTTPKDPGKTPLSVWISSVCFSPASSSAPSVVHPVVYLWPDHGTQPSKYHSLIILFFSTPPTPSFGPATTKTSPRANLRDRDALNF